MARDWLFCGDDYRCDLRAAGVLIQGGKILLQRDKNGVEYAVPGGHVQVGETTENAVKREFREEMGIDIAADRLLWTEECFWQWDGRQMHSLCFYYLVSGKMPDGGNFVSHLDNERVEYGFVPVEQLKNITVYPAFLKDRILCLSDHIEHYISYA